MEIRFYYDQMERCINAIHIQTGKRKKIKNRRKIEWFLEVHGVTLGQCKKVRRDVDRMGLFRTGFAFRLVCCKWLKFVVKAFKYDSE